MTDNDIVTRLRQGWLAHQDKDVRFVVVHAGEWMRCTDLTREAAVEIERLRAERDHAVAALSEQIATLTAERDEARRMYCEEAFCHRFNERRFNERCVPSPISNARQIANNMKWDCFKEDSDE